MSLKKKPAKRLIGCARVSPHQQDLARQIKALKRVGCGVIYSDTASGKHTSIGCRHQHCAWFETPAFGGLLTMRQIIDGTHNSPHGEERAKRASRTTYIICPAEGRGCMGSRHALDAGAGLKVLHRGHGRAAAGRPSPRESSERGEVR